MEAIITKKYASVGRVSIEAKGYRSGPVYHPFVVLRSYYGAAAIIERTPSQPHEHFSHAH